MSEEDIKQLKSLKADREKYKRLTEQNLMDSEEFKNNMCEHRCIKYNEILELQAKANKYDSLVEKIKDKKRYFEERDELIATSNNNYSDGTVIKRIIDILQELLDTEK